MMIVWPLTSGFRVAPIFRQSHLLDVSPELGAAKQQKKPTSSCSGEVAEHRANLLETLADLDDEFAEVGPGERKGMLLAIECLPVLSSTSLALRQFNLSRIAEWSRMRMQSCPVREKLPQQMSSVQNPGWLMIIGLYRGLCYPIYSKFCTWHNGSLL